MEITPETVEQIRLVIAQGTSAGSTIPFQPTPQTVRIGRDVENEVVLTDPVVSRLHAVIEIRPEGCTIRDAGSNRGIEKMGFKVGEQPEPLQSGEEFRIGHTIFRFEIVLKKGALERQAKEAKAARQGKDAKAGGLLDRIGLNTATKRIAVAVLLAGLVVLLLWPAPVELPPQSSAPVAVDYGRVTGFLRGDQSHLDRAVFKVPNDADALGLYFVALGPSGIEIRASDRPVARLEPSAAWESYELLLIMRAFGREPVSLLVDNLGYDAAQGAVDPASVKRWGVREMWLARVGDVASLSSQLSGELGALREVSDHVADDPGNLYKLMKGLRHVALGLMKQSGRSAVLVHVPSAETLQETPTVTPLIEKALAEVDQQRPKESLDGVLKALEQVEAQINREQRHQLNSLAVARKVDSRTDQVAALTRIARLIPDATDPRRRSAIAELSRRGIHVP